MNALGIFLVCALVVVGNNLVIGAHLYPVPSLIQRDLEDDFALRSYEALLELAREESSISEDSDAINFLRRLAHLNHLSKRAEGAAANDANNADLRRRSGGSGQNLNALWKTRNE